MYTALGRGASKQVGKGPPSRGPAYVAFPCDHGPMRGPRALVPRGTLVQGAGGREATGPVPHAAWLSPGGGGACLCLWFFFKVRYYYGYGYVV